MRLKHKLTFLNKLFHSEYKSRLDPTHPKSPQNPWAFIRVSNEAKTLRQSLNSIIGAIHRGIIVYNECTDGSDEIIKDFCAKHTGFIYAEFPHEVMQCHYHKSEENYKKTLSDLYNFTLSFIPQGEWLVKIDTDQIYDAQKLKESFSLAETENSIVFYFRINLHCFDEKIYIEKDRPLSDCSDHWLICNNNLHFLNSIQSHDGENVYYWKLLQIPFGYKAIYAPLNTWHFPNFKEKRQHEASIERYLPFSEIKNLIPQKYFTENKISKDMLEEWRILDYLTPPPPRGCGAMCLDSSKDKTQPLISVIIPIYNVAPYLNECIDSCLNQTYKNLEIILINDGSTDESLTIAKTYLYDTRVTLISQTNAGLSGARNKGIENAKGEYIYFIDSDDYISHKFLEEMLIIAQEYKVECVINDQIIRFSPTNPIKLGPTNTPKVFIPDSRNIVLGGAVWRCLFKKSLLDSVHLRFVDGKIYEDEGFLFMFLPLCKKFVRYTGEPYFYRQRQGSIMAKHKNFRSYDLLDIFEAVYRFYEERGLLESFNPPYYFLWNAPRDYENEVKYLTKAKELIIKLKIPYDKLDQPTKSLSLWSAETFITLRKYKEKFLRAFNKCKKIRKKLSKNCD